MPGSPLVTVLLAVHNGEPFVGSAIASVLGQSASDLELLVVDDGSTDATPETLASVADPRLRVVRNETRSGLAASLNRGLDEAHGRYVARLDADDVALPRRLERQLRRLADDPPCAVVGGAALELDARDRPGRLHLMPSGAVSVRFAALFSSPFLHPTVLVERGALDRHGLRYDAAFDESEDYELWTRLLEREDGDNLDVPLILYRVHPQQASHRRGARQRELQRQVALRGIGEVAPELSLEEAELAWRVGANGLLHDHEAGADAYLRLSKAFERRYGPGARPRVARDLARIAMRAPRASRARIIARALRLDSTLAVRAVRLRARRRRMERTARQDAAGWLAHEVRRPSPIRVAAVFPEPTPYRSPLLDRVASLPEVDLTVLYAADTVAGRTWEVRPRHPAVFLHGRRIPGADRLVRHEYPVTLGVAGKLRQTDPDVVVVSGWSTFTAQATIAWCRWRSVPYVLVVESHDEGPRPGWRRAVKGAVVPSVVRGASGVLVTGTLARDSMVARGAVGERVRVFANTIDVDTFQQQAKQLVPRRAELRAALGASEDDTVVLSVGRLAPEKRYDMLIRAVAASSDPGPVLVLAGEGPERERLVKLGHELDVRLRLVGDWPWARVVELYAAADVFALLSERETWAVVVNEAAACGLPLVLSDRVGAAADLLRDGENGFLVAAGDVSGAAAAIRRLAGDPELRAAQGARSREIVAGWGYGPSVDGFVAAVRDAVLHGRRR